MPNERIVIKNFGAIKHADLQLKKVNVIIGEQGTGKSTIAKLVAIFKDVSFVANPNKAHFSEYYLQNYFHRDTEIVFETDLYLIKVTAKEFTRFYKDARFEDLIRKFNSEYGKLFEGSSSSLELTGMNFVSDLLFRIEKLKGVCSYLPAERSSIVSFNRNIIFNPKNNIPKYFQDFVTRFDQSRKDAKFEIPEFNLKYENIDGTDYIVAKNGKRFPLIESASGFQNLVPIIVITNHETFFGTVPGMFAIEEPELSLFPKTQYAFIKHLIAKCSDSKDDLLFTTHSPYVLSTINNLIYANRIGKKRPRLVSAIIGKEYWLSDKDITAVKLKSDGSQEDLMDYKIGQIKAEEIDDISRQINEEFDKLLEIEYAKK